MGMNYLSVALVLTLLVFAPQSSRALDVILDGSTAIAIEGLPVNGVLYDVTFPLTDANTLYGPNPDFTFPPPDDVTFAVGRVIDVLAAFAATSVGTTSVLQSTSFFVGVQVSNTQPLSIDADNAIYSNASDRWLNVSGTEYLTFTEPRYFAVFEPLGASAPEIDFSAAPETIESGQSQSSTLSWDVLDATTCTGSDGWSGDKNPVSGTEDVSPTVSSTYVLTCNGPGGPSDSQVSVAVLDPTLGTTEVRQTTKVNTISGLDSGPSGTYTKPGFPLVLPQSTITGNTLFHDGGSFTFSSPQTENTYPYGNWAFEIRSTCGPAGDPCLVQTDEGTPWALSNVDVGTGAARMVFTQEGADAFNDLAVTPTIVEVFVTSQSFPGDLQGSAGELTGLDGADNLCTNAAKDAGLTGAWTAWLSDSKIDVVDRMFDAEFRLLNGTLVADNLADLTTPPLKHAIDRDELGGTVAPMFNSSVWTATETDGRYGNSGTCVRWTSSDAVNSGQVGDASAVDAGWTDGGGGNSCDQVNRLYCFSASRFLAEETFGDATFIPEPSAAALATAALTMLGLIRARRRRR